MSGLGLTGVHDLRDIADRLLESERVEYVHEGELIFVPPAGFPHLTIVKYLVRRFIAAFLSGETAVEWQADSEHLQWEYRDGSKRFFIPDVAVAYPGATSRQELQDNVVLIVEVTSPDTPETVVNDRGVKPRLYAKNGVPLYLLVDQERGEWTLYSLVEDEPTYEVHSTGAYGKPILLPEPFGFAVETAEWPSFAAEPRA
ncbi:MAG: Uma2 family endonuclease [Gaiellaceae bacterium]